MIHRIALATKNPGKVREIAAILSSASLEIVAPDQSWEPPPEEFDTYRENALLKAHSLSAHMGIPCLGDDSGIEVDVLNGLPGPRSARFAGEDAIDAQNLEKLIDIV